MKPTPTLALALLVAPIIAFGQSPIPPTILDDPPGLFEPREPRGSEEEDRLIAAAHFAEAQLLLKRGQRHEALSKLERAGRYDPDTSSISQEIVALASRLRRLDEATRYAVLAAERDSTKPSMLIRLGSILVNRGDPDRGLRLFERAEVRLNEAQGEHDKEEITLRIEMGRLYLLRQEPAVAASKFEPILAALEGRSEIGWTEADVLEKVQRPDSLYAVMGECFLLAKRFDESLSAFRRLSAVKPNNELLAWRLARVAAAQEDWDEAGDQLEVYLAANATAGAAAPYELLGQLIRQSEPDPELARKALIGRLQELSSRNRSNLPLKLFLARQLSEAEQETEAIKLYEAVIASRPLAVAHRRLVVLYLSQRNAGGMLKLLMKILAESQSLASVQDEIDLVGQDAEFVAQVMKEAAGQQEQQAKLAGTLLAIAAGDFDEADRLYQLGWGETPSYEAAETIGLALFLADEAERAATLFRAGISAKPPNDKRPVLYYYLASALALNGQYDSALAAAERAAALNDAPRFQSRPAWIAYHGKRYDDARERYDKLVDRLEHDYSSDEVRSVIRDARLILSNINVLQQRMPQAEEQLERVLDEFPSDIGALNDLGYLWADQGKRLTRALTMVEQAVAKAPENRAYRDSLGWAYFRLGKFELAVQELEIAAGEDDPDGVILDHLGDAYREAGRVEDALKAWRSAATALEAKEEAVKARTIRMKIAKNKD